MLTVYTGPDSFQSRQKLGKVLDKEEGTILRFDELSIQKDSLHDSMGSMGLFGGNTVVVLDSVLDNEEAFQYVIDSLSQMNGSLNSFYLLAGVVDAKTLKVIEKSGAALIKSERTETKPKKEFNSFALADAFLRRDKKLAWVLFVKALMRDTSAQEMCGTLAWQMRMLVLAQTTNSPSEAGVSDFSYKKAKSCTKYFSQHEAEEVLRKLVGIYHFDPSLNRGDTSSAIERLILSL